MTASALGAEVLAAATSNGNSDGGEGQQSDLTPQEQLQQASLESLRALRMPNTRREDYRFTDITPILES